MVKVSRAGRGPAERSPMFCRADSAAGADGRRHGPRIVKRRKFVPDGDRVARSLPTS